MGSNDVDAPGPRDTELTPRSTAPSAIDTPQGSAPVDGWLPIETAPTTGQFLVTTDDVDKDEGGYGEIELVCAPFLKDGRILNQNSGNYTRPNVWRWWHPAPPRRVAPIANAIAEKPCFEGVNPEGVTSNTKPQGTT